MFPQLPPWRMTRSPSAISTENMRSATGDRPDGRRSHHSLGSKYTIFFSSSVILVITLILNLGTAGWATDSFFPKYPLQRWRDRGFRPDRPLWYTVGDGFLSSGVVSMTMLMYFSCQKLVAIWTWLVSPLYSLCFPTWWCMSLESSTKISRR